MRKWTCRALCLLLCALMLPLLPGKTQSSAEAPAEGEDVPVLLSVSGPVRFTNVLYHYVELCMQVTDERVNELTLRVWRPDGTPAAFRTRAHVRNDWKAVKSYSFPVNKDRENPNRTEIFFKSDCETGVWRLEVSALAGKKEMGSAALDIEVLAPYAIEPADYARVRERVRFPTADGAPPEVQAGTIRFCAQLPEDPCFILSDWKSAEYDFSKDSRDKCTRCILAMALSYLGIDCTPVRMSELVRAYKLSITYRDVIKALGNVERVDGDLETLWEHYEQDGYSPVYIHFTYKGGMHALLLIARDSLNPDLYYAVNSSAAVNASMYPGGAGHEHIIPILIEDGKIGKMIQSPRVRRYHKGELDVICQWRRTD